MNKLSINLIPKEVVEKEKQSSSRSFKIKIFVSILSVFVLISLSLIGLRLWQSQESNRVQDDLNKSVAKVSSYKEKEGLAFFLNQRLTDIKKIKSIESQESAAYNLVASLATGEIQIISINSTQKGSVNLSAESLSTQSIQNFLDRLIDPTKNQGGISKVIISSLSKTASNTFRFDLAVVLGSADAKPQPEKEGK